LIPRRLAVAAIAVVAIIVASGVGHVVSRVLLKAGCVRGERVRARGEVKAYMWMEDGKNTRPEALWMTTAAWRVMQARALSKLAAKRTATNGTIDLLVIIILSGKQSRHLCARLRKM
jgi:hypothetical protein